MPRIAVTRFAALLAGLLLAAAPLRAEPPSAPTAKPLELLRQEYDGTCVYATDAGAVALPRTVLPPGHRAPDAHLRALIARAAASGHRAPGDAPWRWGTSVVTGGHLTRDGGAILVVPGGVLERSTRAEAERSGEPAEVRTLALAFRQALEASAEVTPWMRGAVADLLERLTGPDGNPALEELDGAFARRIVSGGSWLARVVPAADAVARRRLEEGIAHALRLTAHDVYEGDGHHLMRLADAWGDRGVVLRGPRATIYARVPFHPMDADERMMVLGACRVRVALPAGADPLTDPGCVARFTHAELRHPRERAALASWDAARGFRADRKHWRRLLPVPSARHALRDGFPPHLAVAGPDGHLHALVVPGGVLRPARQGSPEEAERFLSDAARLLPDAAYLDLLQQYFVRYAADSPDVTVPLGVGCAAFCGEIHQSVGQIVETVTRGVCRGDCDDIAEFVQAVARRQGKLAHAVSVTAHMAVAWAERHADGWHAYMLQAGPSREFVRPELSVALRDLFRSLDPADPVDLNSLRISLRFFGQNTRADYGLSWRIFEDRKYAETLIDVQQDWHRMTLLGGIEKMLRLVASGDHTTSNYSELASLYNWTAQPARAVDFKRTTLAHVKEPESRLVQTTELISMLLSAKRMDEAATLVEDVLARQVPAQAESLGLRALNMGIELAAGIADDDAALAARTLARTHHLVLASLGGSLHALMTAEDRVERWKRFRGREVLQRLMRDYAWAAIGILGDLEGRSASGGATSAAKHVAEIRAVLAPWMEHHSMDDVEDGEGAAWRWALHARWARVGAGDAFVERVLAAPLPRPVPIAQQKALARSRTPAVVHAWAHASPYFATGLLFELAGEKTAPRPAALARLARLLDEATAAAKALGLYGQGTESSVRDARILVALLQRDEARLRTLLRAVRALDDRSVYGELAGTYSAAARHLDPAWWRKAVALWVEEVDHDPSILDMAWRCVHGEARAHALHVADVAAGRRPDDAAVVREARLMHALLDAK